MKVKLLKKVRKRYSITHYPNGVYISDHFFKGPVTIVRDNNNDYRLEISVLEKPVAYYKLYDIILDWIQQDYGRFRSKTHRITSEQLWYKK